MLRTHILFTAAIILGVGCSPAIDVSDETITSAVTNGTNDESKQAFPPDEPSPSNLVTNDLRILIFAAANLVEAAEPTLLASDSRMFVRQVILTCLSEIADPSPYSSNQTLNIFKNLFRMIAGERPGGAFETFETKVHELRVVYLKTFRRMLTPPGRVAQEALANRGGPTKGDCTDLSNALFEYMQAQINKRPHGDRDAVASYRIKEADAHDESYRVATEMLARRDVPMARTLSLELGDMVALGDYDALNALLLEGGHYEHFLEEALEEFRQGNITLNEMASLNMMASAIEQLVITPKVVVSYAYQTLTFDFPQFQNLFKDKVTSNIKTISYDMPEVLGFLQIQHDEGRYENAEYENLMRGATAFERRALLIPVPDQGLSVLSPHFSLIEKITKLFAPFMRADRLTYVVVPTMSMLEAALRIHAQSSDNVPGIRIAYGGQWYSDAVSDLQHARHVLNLQYPTKLFEKADGHHVGLWGFTTHDFYHLLRLTFIPKRERLAIAHAHSLIASLPQRPDDEDYTKKLKNIKNALVDMELYRSSAGEPFGDVFKPQRDLAWPQEAIDVVLKDMVANAADWLAKYQLDRSKLGTDQQLRYDVLKAELTGEPMPRYQGCGGLSLDMLKGLSNLGTLESLNPKKSGLRCWGDDSITSAMITSAMRNLERLDLSGVDLSGADLSNPSLDGTAHAP